MTWAAVAPGPNMTPDVKAEFRRVDALQHAESRRLDGLLKAQETAVTAALAAAEKAVSAALAASEKAVVKAEASQQRVNETQNEFRGTLADQAKNFMPRIETENLVRELRNLIAVQDEVIGGLRSRLDVGPPSLAVLQARSDSSNGGNAAIQQGWKYLLAVGSLVLGIAGLLLALR